MKLPVHIADEIRRLAKHHTGTRWGHIDREAADHDGIALMGTIGSTWLLRPDGTFWDVDRDTGKALQPLPETLHVDALVEGAQRYPWLAELLPQRPPEADTCSACRGHAWIGAAGTPRQQCLLCPTCHGLGWV